MKRVVYATLKSHTHKGCLKAGRAKLESKKSQLYKKFDHPYAPDPRIIVASNHRLETKEILMTAIDQRLGEAPIEENLRLTKSTDYGRELFLEDVASFCALMGNYKIWAHLNTLDDAAHVDVKMRNASLVLFLAKSINIYELFPEFSSFLKDFERLKGIQPDKHREILSKIKRMRSSFLIILDNLVTLKKRLSQEKNATLSKEKLIEQRRVMRNALVGIASNRHHQKNIIEAMMALDPHYDPRGYNMSSEIRRKYPNFFYLIFLIRYTDLLNTQCLQD